MAGASFFNSSNNGTTSIKPTAGGSVKSPKGVKGKKVAKGLGAGFGVLIAVVAVVMVIVYFVAIRPAYALLSNVNEIREDIARAQEAATNRDLVELSKIFDELQTDLNDLREARNSTVGWAENFPLTKGYYADSEHFINAGLHMIDAGRELIVLVVPFADAGGFKVSEEQEVVETGLADAFAQWIAIMPDIAQNIDGVLAKLSLAGEELAQVDASRYPENFRGQPVRSLIEGAQVTLVQLNDAGPDIKRALVIIPEIMGVGGEKRYMILMENDKEIRGTGGFWTYISTFRLSNALLNSDFTSNGTYNVDFALDAIDPYYTFPAVPQAYRDHLKVERMFARDANVSPDLPTAVDQFMLFWELAMPLNSDFKPVDGVFTINTQVLEELLQVTGPVTLNGTTYDSETVTLELEKIASLELAEQANRKRILGDLMEAMLVNVFESDSNLWPKLVDKGIDLAMRKHVKAYMYDPAAQELIEKYNFGGRIVDPVEGDYAYLVSTNLGGGKTNTWFVNKDVTHNLDREGDRWVRTVSANFNYGEKGPEYSPFVVRYQDWVRLYVPAGSELISVEGSEDPAGEGEELNKKFYHGYITLGPGESKTITFKYYLPEGIVGGDDYKLYIQKQSGINSEPHTVIVAGGTPETIQLDRDHKYSTPL